MKRAVVRLGLLVGILLALSGCFSRTVDELYCLPKPAEDYVELDNQINALREEINAEYASPKTGGNTTPVQLQDLDNDGQSESVVAFFRANSGEEPLKICIFSQRPDGNYMLDYTIKGDGLAIHSVKYVDLDGDSKKEIVVSWQMGTRQYILTPYQLTQTGAIRLAEISYNQGYTDCDLNQDNQKELMVFRTDETTPDNGLAEYYVYQDAQVTRAAMALMSKNTGGGESSIREGFLPGNLPAVYINSKSGGATVTDVFALRDGVLTNITLNEKEGISLRTLRYVDINPTDINSDGVLELPEPIEVREYQSTSEEPNFWFIRWRQFDVYGESKVVQTTYHNFSDNWYLTIPEQWIGQITISRDDTRTNQGERSVVFSRWNGSDESVPEEFLRIYRLEGENRELRARRGDRFILLRSNRLIYAAEFTQLGWNAGVDESSLGARFSVSRTEWSNQ